MAQALLNNPRMDPSANQTCGMSMPEIMQPDAGVTRLSSQLLKVTSDYRWIQQTAKRPRAGTVI